MLGNFACFLSSADFFQNQLIRKILSGISSECQTVWIQIRPDISDLVSRQKVKVGVVFGKMNSSEDVLCVITFW